MRPLLGVSIVFLLACTGLFQKDDPTGGQSSDSSNATTSTTGGTTHVGGPGVFDPCSAYGGALGKGATWTYAYADAQGNTGTTISEVASRDSSDGTLTMEMSSDYTYTNLQNYHSEYVGQYHCSPDGWFLDHAESSLSYSANGQKYRYQTETIYDQPYLILPPNPEKGDAWTSEATGTSITDGTEAPFQISSDCELKKPEAVQVEAGDYTALKEVCTSSGTSYNSWLAEGIGVVKTDSTELVEFSE